MTNQAFLLTFESGAQLQVAKQDGYAWERTPGVEEWERMPSRWIDPISQTPQNGITWPPKRGAVWPLGVIVTAEEIP